MILLVEKGSGTHTIDFKEHQVEDQMVFFLAPGQAHQWDLSPDTSGYQILFSMKFLLSGKHRLPYFNLSAAPYLLLHNEQYLALILELQQIEKEEKLADDLHIDLIQTRLQVVLLLLKRWYSENFDVHEYAPDHRIINHFLALLENHYTDHSEVGFYANEMSVTANYLNQVCRKKAGVTAGDLIRERILLEAKRLLSLTPLDIKEIAYTLGFNDASYFSRFFKKYTDLSPQEFRKMNN